MLTFAFWIKLFCYVIHLLRIKTEPLALQYYNTKSFLKSWDNLCWQMFKQIWINTKKYIFIWKESGLRVSVTFFFWFLCEIPRTLNMINEILANITILGQNISRYLRNIFKFEQNSCHLWEKLNNNIFVNMFMSLVT